MVALREQFGVADLNRPSVNILRDLLIIMRCRAEHFLDLRLMRYVGDFSGAHRLPSIVVSRMHTFGTPAPSGKVPMLASSGRGLSRTSDGVNTADDCLSR